MIGKYERIIINKLIDKYEKSKSFIGENKVNQKFSVKISALFSKYNDHSNYEVFQGVNEAIDVLVRKSFIIAQSNTAHVYNNVVLNTDNLEAIYIYVDRVPKKDINSAVIRLLDEYKEKNEVLKEYCLVQHERIHQNKSIQFFSNDLKEFKNLLLAVDELMKVQTETFARDFSVRVFKDSKVFERVAPKAVNLIFEFGNYPDRDQVLGNLNIVKNPTYVNLKGAGYITINGQLIDLTRLSSDIGISSAMLTDIDRVDVIGKAVITIENLTSFHSFSNEDMLAIYLGGYHNSVRREFIKKIHHQNPKTVFYHFGDIDAGGFYILEHLKNQTGIDFIPFKMDIETIKTYAKYTKRLTENDKNRLRRLADSQYGTVINYMLENNCKLEQEAINL
ncbi:DUF2399 domain-containing protein [Alkaliphilus pronyensis]|uniref:DUF2399 domain-containing protein n=1 Tax=Alkaliphilus pronyensis TaxID=1482732 RepID=A0A6I0F7X0_9FIRM|nr:Wadjet anti-phage system protein JetD domain-containing protein [Alkaliphilus pronyensis]KAB3536069.1 DUF2399 domain-containing protein [Alkaliphilus pronyensis]